MINISSSTLNLLAQNKSILLKDRICFEKELENRGESAALISGKNQNIKLNKELLKGYSFFLILIPILYFNYLSVKTLVNQGQKAQNQFYVISLILWLVVHLTLIFLSTLLN